jgi:hypothetical protein
LSLKIIEIAWFGERRKKRQFGIFFGNIIILIENHKKSGHPDFFAKIGPVELP